MEKEPLKNKLQTHRMFYEEDVKSAIELLKDMFKEWSEEHFGVNPYDDEKNEERFKEFIEIINDVFPDLSEAKEND